MSTAARVLSVAVLGILVVAGVFGSLFYSSSSELSSEKLTITQLQSSISSLTSSALASTVTTTITSRSVVTVTSTHFPGVPWDTVWFMLPPDGGNGAFSWGGNFSRALLFDCPTAGTDGCAVRVFNSLVRSNYSITVWYPKVSQTNEPAWANCEYSVAVLPSGEPTPGGPGFAYCVAIGTNAFVVGEQGSIPV